MAATYSGTLISQSQPSLMPSHLIETLHTSRHLFPKFLCYLANCDQIENQSCLLNSTMLMKAGLSSSSLQCVRLPEIIALFLGIIVLASERQKTFRESL